MMSFLGMEPGVVKPSPRPRRGEKSAQKRALDNKNNIRAAQANYRKAFCVMRLSYERHRGLPDALVTPTWKSFDQPVEFPAREERCKMVRPKAAARDQRIEVARIEAEMIESR